MSNSENSTQLAVIGAGPGGYPAAFHAADLGMEVTLIDPEPNPGGVCLYRGCIPSKALLHVAAFLHEARQASDWGVSCGEVKLDLDKLRNWKTTIIEKLTGGVGELCRQRKITYVQGYVRFKDPKTLSIHTVDGKKKTLSFEHAILATGSVPATIPSLMTSPLVMTSKEALALEDVPERLLVIGGGYIGLELGNVYAALGSKVSVVEMTSEILPGVDRDLVRPLQRTLKEDFDEIVLDTKVVEVVEKDGKLQVRLEGKESGSKVEVFDKALLAVGRKPMTEGVGLEKTGVEIGKGGFVVVDAQRRTAEPSIFAIGDVAGQPMLAHKATHEARVAVEAIAGKKTVFEPGAIPAVVFTNPEIAWCGLTEREAKEQGREIEVLKFPWTASGRALTLGRNDGLTKLIVEPENGRILGVGITGVNAGELIAQGVQAIEMGAVAEDLALTIHAHPTLSETMMEAAEGFGGHSTHFLGRKGK